MGIWASKQMEDKTSIGRKMLSVLYAHENVLRNGENREAPKVRKMYSTGNGPALRMRIVSDGRARHLIAPFGQRFGSPKATVFASSENLR